MFADRDDFDDAIDFVGWYNHTTNKTNGIAKDDAFRLFLAYHEGHGGYRRGTWRGKRWLLRVAERVDHTAREYGAQLRRCEERFKCRRWYQVGPLCG